VGFVAAHGVLLDFSGTLFRFTSHLGGSWRQRLHAAGVAIPDLETQAELMRVLTSPVRPLEDLPAELLDTWYRRDLDPELHRAVYLGMLKLTGVSDDLADACYAQVLDTDCWEPYPDTRAALELLRAKGIPVAVVSNIAFDIRPAFDRIGVAGLVDEFVLSYVEGSMKPDAKIFRIACERLGVEPSDALMIGDSAEADGGAAALGAEVRIIEPLPPAARPDALLHALASVGIS
jgi:HAD superfamily hydrolase (TIGR01509 family)